MKIHLNSSINDKPLFFNKFLKFSPHNFLFGSAKVVLNIRKTNFLRIIIRFITLLYKYFLIIRIVKSDNYLLYQTYLLLNLLFFHDPIKNLMAMNIKYFSKSILTHEQILKTSKTFKLAYQFYMFYLIYFHIYISIKYIIRYVVE